MDRVWGRLQLTIFDHDIIVLDSKKRNSDYSEVQNHHELKLSKNVVHI